MELLAGIDSKHSCAELGATLDSITSYGDPGKWIFVSISQVRKLRHCEGLCLG